MIEQLVQETLRAVPQRTRDVVSRRYGLASGKGETLDRIGKNMRITRERVRQIEASGLASIRKSLPKAFGEFSRIVHDHLKHFDGVREESRLVREIAYVADEESASPAHIQYLLTLDPSLTYMPQTESCMAFWTDSPKTAEKVGQFVKLIDKAFAKKAAPVSVEDAEPFFTDVAKKAGIKSSRAGVALSYACLNQHVTFSPFGFIGAAHMKEIVPVNVGDKALLVLRQATKPLHFRDLAKAINAHASVASNFHPVWQRTVRAQTVHNELIRNNSFVLVGRGLYALKEWGYAGGTVKEIIAEILQKSGKPLLLQDIVKRVQKRKIVKESTIFINLQNKKFFVRDASGKYVLRRIGRAMEEA